ncbi:MAG: glucose-1-phosphate adenylyltransferase [Nitrospirae bacterium]|nr:glucose-1-phosphate adenylyltransferase [Nitrospirota bacterium]
MRNVLTMVMAGGKGERLYPLTLHRAKPAVPFGGKYRIIDFTLSNCINSGMRKIIVLTQYKSHSLERHLNLGWNFLNPEMDEYIMTLPPQQRVDEHWYQGTADAIYQNLYSIEKENPSHLMILSGDHIYKMDYSKMLAYHKKKKAQATVGAIEVSLAEASSFGIVEVDDEYTITGFAEKPRNPKPIPGKPEHAFASMGIYIFNTEVITEFLKEDAGRKSSHDFGKDIIPLMQKKCKVVAYNFRDENKKKAKYWRDVGTIDSYWEANLDLATVDPLFNLYDRGWPLRTYQGQYPPAKFVFAQEFKGGRLGVALDSVVSGGVIISGGRVQNSVLAQNVRVNSYTEVHDSVIMENVDIGRHCRIKKAIIDKDVRVPAGTTIGYDPAEDARRFVVSPGGVVVVAKGQVIE